MDPCVSVIIPTFNRAGYIARAVESALSQTLPPLEVIVIDDGSTDDTRFVLTPYVDRIRYVYQANQGVSAARNHGLRLARGEFIAFLDSDDYFSPDKLGAQVALLQADAAIGMVHSGWTVVDEAGRPIRAVEPWLEAPRLNLETWLLWKPIHSCGLLFRKGWLERVGGFNPSLHHAEDVDLVFRLALAGCRAVWLRQQTFCYREHGGSLTRDTREGVRSLLGVLEDFLRRPGIPWRIRRAEAKIWYYTRLWGAWQLLEADSTAEAIALLRRCRAHTRLPQALMVLDWASNVGKWLVRDGRRISEGRRCWPSLRTGAVVDEARWAELEGLLQWWETVWWNFLKGDETAGVVALRAFQHLSPYELIQHLIACLLVHFGPIPRAAVAGLWEDARKVWGASPEAWPPLTALSRSLCSRALQSRQWALAMWALRRSVPIGGHWRRRR